MNQVAGQPRGPKQLGCCTGDCRRQARRALRTGRSANQILIVDEVLAEGDAEFQKIPEQNSI